MDFEGLTFHNDDSSTVDDKSGQQLHPNEALQSPNSNNAMLGAVLFGDIPQQGWFYYQGVKLMKFGKYGMGVDTNGTVAKVFSDDMQVSRADCT